MDAIVKLLANVTPHAVYSAAAYASPHTGDTPWEFIIPLGLAVVAVILFVVFGKKRKK